MPLSSELKRAVYIEWQKDSKKFENSFAFFVR